MRPHPLPTLLFALSCSLVTVNGTAHAQTLAEPIRTELIAKGFSGTVLVTHRGQRVAFESFGLAERAFGVPATNDTRYRVASITKLFAAALVMQLVEAGKLDLHQHIRRYLPDYRGEGASKVTLHQLLSHTSGITNFDQVKSYDDALANGIPAYQLPRTPRQLLDLHSSGPLVAEPGTKFDYNNADYVVLGQIVEHVTGKPFAEALKSGILAPLGLQETGMAEQQAIIPRLAPSYFRPDTSTPLTNDLPVYFQNWYAAGAMYSTANDVAMFADALFGGRLIGASSLRQLLTPVLGDYGYGLWVDSVTVAGRKRAIGHRPGSIMGTNTVIVRYFDEALTVVILANTNVVDTDALAFRIGRTVLESR